jgi:hypothetical protein
MHLIRCNFETSRRGGETEPSREQELQSIRGLLKKHSSKIVVSEAIELLPEDVPLASVEDILENIMQQQADKVRNVQVS